MSSQPEDVVKERVKTKKKEPTVYKVVLLNDDYTTMEFVVHVLETVFQKTSAEAYQIMMHVHVNGRGIAGVYSWEVAETKVDTVTSLAQGRGLSAEGDHRGSLKPPGPFGGPYRARSSSMSAMSDVAELLHVVHLRIRAREKAQIGLAAGQQKLAASRRCSARVGSIGWPSTSQASPSRVTPHDLQDSRPCPGSSRRCRAPTSAATPSNVALTTLPPNGRTRMMSYSRIGPAGSTSSMRIDPPFRIADVGLLHLARHGGGDEMAVSVAGTIADRGLAAVERLGDRGDRLRPARSHRCLNASNALRDPLRDVGLHARASARPCRSSTSSRDDTAGRVPGWPNVERHDRDRADVGVGLDDRRERRAAADQPVLVLVPAEHDDRSRARASTSA